MLLDFLKEEQNPIITLCKEKIRALSQNKVTSGEMDKGLPLFYQEIIDVLSRDAVTTSGGEKLKPAFESKSNVASDHGKESLRLGYTISQVVHGYGAVCQAITEHTETKDVTITSREFQELNLCLDVAIAEAVTEFSNQQVEQINTEEVQRLGFLAHELRNALSAAALAHALIQKGFVGVDGSTSRIVSKHLERMRDLIDRSFAEVRLRTEPIVEYQRVRLIDLVGEIEGTAAAEAKSRCIDLTIEVDPAIEINCDPHLLISAVSNLIQNAFKFTKPASRIWLRAKIVGERAVIEIQDQCGGFSDDNKIEDLFQPFTQRRTDRTGLGLGLSISRRAVKLNGGLLSASNIPGEGCIFTIDLPLAAELETSKMENRLETAQP